MNDERKTVPIEVVAGAEFAKPSDQPVKGERRLVRMLPVPLPGIKHLLFPAIWISPYEINDKDEGPVKLCLVLMGKGPPSPEIVCVRMAQAGIEKFPFGPVEW